MDNKPTAKNENNSNVAEAGGIEPSVQRIVLEQPSAFGRYGKFLVIALGIAIMMCFTLYGKYQSYFSEPNGPEEKYKAFSKTATKKIAIIKVTGGIMDSDGFIKQQIDRINEDPNVVGVVLRINSPGGTVAASDYLYHHLKKMRNDNERKLPMVVSMGGICASGGYYLAMAVDSSQKDVIFAEPSTWTGSIGVVIPHYNLSGLLEKYNIEDDSIASHENKLMGSPTRMLDDKARAKERELLQTLVNQSFERFKDIVKGGRPGLAKNDENLKTATTGQVFSAEKALKLGLVDKIGYIEEAIERAAELAGHKVEEIRCVEYKQNLGPLSAILGVDASNLGRGQSQSPIADMIDLATPRAYYLWNAAPSILSNQK